MLMVSIAVAPALLMQAVPAVPGGCTAAASENVGAPGCYLSAELTIEASPPTLYWHIVRMRSEAPAKAEVGRYRWATAVPAHGRWWLYVLSADAREPKLPDHHVVGPFRTKRDGPVVARFMESLFPPGMRTRVHAHSGPEAFYVIDGEQCTETPDDRRRIKAGESYIVPGGLHLQAAPKGRRNVVLVLAPVGEPWISLSDAWAGTGYCES